MISNNACSISTLDLIRFNICGRRFEIQRSTASRYPNSLFGILATDAKDGKEELLRSKGIFHRFLQEQPSIEEWYAERSIAAFELIIDYMCTERLHCPGTVCKEVLRNELAFWRLHEVPLADCCWDDEDEDADIQKHLEEKSEREEKRRERHEGDVNSSLYCKYAKKIKMAVKRVVGKPTSSKAATVFSTLSVFFITLAITNVVVSTLPSLQKCKDPTSFSRNSSNVTVDTDNVTMGNGSGIFGNVSNTTDEKPISLIGLKYQEHCEVSIVFEIVEAICIGWFTFEWLLRFGCASKKCAFLRSPLNIIDLLAIIPFYVDVIIYYADADSSRRHQGIQNLLSVLRVFRAFRFFNVLRLARYSESLQLMGASLWRSRNELSILVVFIGFTITIFSSIVFYCEKDTPGTSFTSIPATLYWGIVTITTVGYGDMVPATVPGKLFASVSCVVGIIIVAFPVSILVEHFHRLYRRRSKKSPAPHRVAIMVGHNLMGVVQSNVMPRPTKIYDFTSKL